MGLQARVPIRNNNNADEELDEVELAKPSMPGNKSALMASEPLKPAEIDRSGSFTSNKSCILLVAIIALVFVGLLFFIRAKQQQQVYRHQNFITVSGIKFYDGNTPFYPTGLNIDNIVEAAIPSVSNRYSVDKPSGRQMVQDVLYTAAQSNLNVIRIWAHTTDPAHPLQLAPGGVYDPDVWDALDYTIAMAERYGLRVILSLADNWKYKGGVDEMIDWSTTAPARDTVKFPALANIQGDVSPDMFSQDREEYEAKRKALFFTDPGSKKIYKSHVSHVLNRKNKYTGERYKDAKTIMSFNLLNEPRCNTVYTPNCADIFHFWVEEMAAYFKSIDRRHLLTIGGEGFWGFDDPHAQYNPGASGGSNWAAETGMDFIRNHMIKDISYCAVHSWPDNFNVQDLDFHQIWLEKHSLDGATRLNKPVLLEEVGKKIDTTLKRSSDIQRLRDSVYRRVYQAVEEAIAHPVSSPNSGNALQGCLFWQLDFQIYDQSPPSPYGVSVSSSTFDIIKDHATRVKSYTHAQLIENNKGDDECWVGVHHALFDKIHACENRIDVCMSMVEHARYRQFWDKEEGRLIKHQDVEVYETKAACCRPGLGAFATGCSF